MALGGSLPKINLGVQAVRGRLVTDQGQVTRTTPELAPTSPNFHTTPRGRCLSVDIINAHLLQRYMAQNHDSQSVTLTTRLPRPPELVEGNTTAVKISYI
ncbi:hypothetical protein TNCV_377121 [Trichonephila clavipes]|nr:hypothetical protein TNCV_377121 [Trichonephila clavipes]